KRIQLLFDGYAADVRLVPGVGAAVDVLLQVGVFEGADRELLPQCRGDVGQVDLRRVQRVRLQGPGGEGPQVAVAELGGGGLTRGGEGGGAEGGLPSWTRKVTMSQPGGGRAGAT